MNPTVNYSQEPILQNNQTQITVIIITINMLSPSHLQGASIYFRTIFNRSGSMVLVLPEELCLGGRMSYKGE